MIDEIKDIINNTTDHEEAYKKICETLGMMDEYYISDLIMKIRKTQNEIVDDINRRSWDSLIQHCNRIIKNCNDIKDIDETKKARENRNYDYDPAG